MTGAAPATHSRASRSGAASSRWAGRLQATAAEETAVGRCCRRLRLAGLRDRAPQIMRVHNYFHAEW